MATEDTKKTPSQDQTPDKGRRDALKTLATVPILATLGLQTGIPFAASSMLIAVSVVLETKRQLDDLLISRNYDTIS